MGNCCFASSNGDSHNHNSDDTVMINNNINYVNVSVEEINLGQDDETTLNAMRVEKMRTAVSMCDSNHDPNATAHVKGFASGLADLTEIELSGVVDIVANLLHKHCIQKIVWDGDDYGSDSFTCVLPKLQERMPDLKFMAFLSQCDKDKRWGNDKGFDGSWKSRLSKNLNVVLVDDDIASGDRYDQLGILALQATRAKMVIAIGGGDILRQEYEGSDGVPFVLLNAFRHAKGVMEPSSICGLDGVEVVNMPAGEGGTKQHPWAGDGNT